MAYCDGTAHIMPWFRHCIHILYSSRRFVLEYWPWGRWPIFWVVLICTAPIRHDSDLLCSLSPAVLCSGLCVRIPSKAGRTAHPPRPPPPIARFWMTLCFLAVFSNSYFWHPAPLAHTCMHRGRLSAWSPASRGWAWRRGEWMEARRKDKVCILLAMCMYICTQLRAWLPFFAFWGLISAATLPHTHSSRKSCWTTPKKCGKLPSLIRKYKGSFTGF